jgi:hypothetical protein
MCSIDGCDAKVVAKGLCAKHYMRQRRNGDPEKVRKAGRPKTEWSHHVDHSDHWSRRTQARFKAAVILLRSLNPEDDQFMQEALKLMELARRPSGETNVSQFLDLAAERYLAHLANAGALDGLGEAGDEEAGDESP